MERVTPTGATSATAGGADIVGKGPETADGPGPYVMAASSLDSDRVISSDGNEVGKVKEIMLDVRGGRIAYVVMSSGGFLGIGDKLMAIPWGALTLDTDRKCFLLDVSSERVKTAPGFDKNQWPAMADLSWARTVHEYYGREPYWQDQDPDRYAREDEIGREPPTGGSTLL